MKPVLAALAVVALGAGGVLLAGEDAPALAELKAQLKRELKAEILAELRSDLPWLDGCGQRTGRGRNRAAGPGRGRRAGCRLQTTGAVRATPAYVARLQEALQREYRALSHYEAATAAFPGVRRFANLARAERCHADAIRTLIEKLGAKPLADATTKTAAPRTAAEADAAAAAIEAEVIDFYAQLLEDCPDPNILPVLERIQAANRRHLAAVGQ